MQLPSQWRYHALKQASVQVEQGRRVLLVTLDTGERWTQGVIGISAGRVKEQFHRPIVVCTLVEGGWRGSGRSVKGYDLGKIIRQAVEAGVIQRGGGHEMAGGLQVSDEQRLALGRWLEKRCYLRKTDLVEKVEFVGEATEFDAREWNEIFSKLAPFGSENPAPYLGAERAVRVGQPAVIRRGPEKTKSLSPQQVDWLLKYADVGKIVRKQLKESLERVKPPATGNDRPKQPPAAESIDSQPEKSNTLTDIIGLRGSFSLEGPKGNKTIELTMLNWWTQRALWESEGPCELKLKPKCFKSIADSLQYALVITQWRPCTPQRKPGRKR